MISAGRILTSSRMATSCRRDGEVENDEKEILTGFKSFVFMVPNTPNLLASLVIIIAQAQDDCK